MCSKGHLVLGENKNKSRKHAFIPYQTPVGICSQMVCAPRKKTIWTRATANMRQLWKARPSVQSPFPVPHLLHSLFPGLREAPRAFRVSIPQSHVELTRNQIKALQHAVKVNSLTSCKDILIFVTRFFKLQGGEKRGIISEIAKNKPSHSLSDEVCLQLV